MPIPAKATSIPPGNVAMLFCSRNFLFFFTAVFIAYWALPTRRGRAAIFGLLGAYVWAKWPALMEMANAFIVNVEGSEWHKAFSTCLQATTWDIWLAAIIAFSTLLAFRTGTHQARIVMLLLASFCFYGSWSYWLALVVAVSSVIDYLLARGMEATASQHARKFLVILSVVMNLGLLAFFKYVDFFMHSLEEALRLAGATASLPVLGVIVPIGISFYTFEAINYTVDVYRKKVPAERDLLHFMLFITFFPHLVAGPIVRARDFLPQIRRRKRWDWPRMQLGVQFLLMGLVKKLAIADRMEYWVNPVFGAPADFSSHSVWLGVIAWTVRIYCDFSGYTDMALGAAHMLDYRLAKNFNMPYLAVNIADFWRRWHISLSTWLRDYLFIPLGGSRGTLMMTCRNLLIVMLLGGLWHVQYDAKREIYGWTYLVWGGLHGLLLVGHKLFQTWCKNWPTVERCLLSVPGTALRISTTLLCVTICWVFFRAVNLADAGEVLKRMFVPHAGKCCPINEIGLWLTVLLVVVCHIVGQLDLWRKLAVRLPAPALGFGYAVALNFALVLTPETSQTFIYFQY